VRFMEETYLYDIALQANQRPKHYPTYQTQKSF
jgi:hypothetical protein